MFTYGASSNPDLEPEEAVNYEAGICHQFHETLRAEVSLYWIRLDNEIWYDAAERRYENCGKTSHQGVESSLDFEIMDGLTTFANYTYTRAKYKSGEEDGSLMPHFYY